MAEEKRDKRELILEAAAVVFAQRGYHQAKVEEIAIQAGIGKGTVYEYFSSKLELFQEMFKSILGKYFAELRSLQDQRGSVTERLRQLLEIHLDFINRNSDFARVTFVDGAVMDEELSWWMYRQRQEKVERLRELFQEGIARHEFRPIDPGLLAEMFTGAMAAIIIPVLMEGKTVEPHKIADQVMDILLHGVRLD